MKLALTITIFTIVCFVASFAKAQDLRVLQKTTIKSAQQTEVTELTEPQAIEFAEKFIRRNGYTDCRPTKKTSLTSLSNGNRT